VELAREDYERKQRLFADGALTRSALDQSRNHYLGLDSAYRSAQARIGNPEGELRSGMIISLRILLEKRRTLVVPAEALLDESGGFARVVVVSNGAVRSAKISLGRRSDREVELLSGLAEGDEVVVSGQNRLRDGQRVKTYRAD